MRMLFVTGSLVHGGAERHTITLANRLAERGHECHVAYIKNDPSQLARLTGAASVRCLEARKYLDFKALGKLVGSMAEIRPAVIVAVNPYALLYAALARRHAAPSAALMVTYHTTVPASAKEWLQMLYYRPFFWNADCLVFLCEAQRRYWLRRLVFARVMHTIHNGIDPEYWSAPGPEVRARLRSVLGLADGDYVIALCAVLRPEKNHLQLVDAIAYLHARGIAARALMIGDGPMRSAIEARARTLGVSAAVLMAGFQQDVRPLLCAADAVALCSTAVETFALAALEAMALGRPVVLSDIGGAAEMVRPGAEGFLFPAGNTAALVDRLAALRDEGLRRRMGAAARETLETRFSERVMVDRYENLLQQLTLKRSQRDNLRRSATAHQG